MFYLGYQCLWRWLDVLFPPQCAGCGAWGARFCWDCVQQIKPIQHPICQICGDALASPGLDLCGRCQAGRPACAAIRSSAIYEGVIRNAVLHLKNQRDFGLGLALADQLGALLQEQAWSVDLITAVPLDQERLHDRGFNQSDLLAKPLALKTGLQFSNTALIRKRRTRSQVGLTQPERLLNVRQAFQAQSEVVAHKTVLVIDDVFTSGATLNACAAALLEAQAKQVYGLTLARAARLQGESCKI